MEGSRHELDRMLKTQERGCLRPMTQDLKLEGQDSSLLIWTKGLRETHTYLKTKD